MIGPSENGAGASPAPAIDRTSVPGGPKVFIGVLKPDSNLLSIFPGRVIPLTKQNPSLVKVQTSKGPRFLRCMIVPFDKLTLEHQLAVIERVSEELHESKADAEKRLKSFGYYAVQSFHFAAVLEAQCKSDWEGKT